MLLLVLDERVEEINSGIQNVEKGHKSRPRFSPGGAGVESTTPNVVQPLRKRAAEMKHGFEPYVFVFTGRRDTSRSTMGSPSNCRAPLVAGAELPTSF
jgi:hypothetical protein